MRAKLTLKADFYSGEGDIGNQKRWHEDNDPLMRADLLKDWIGLLTKEYNLAVSQLFNEMESNTEQKREVLR